ncbi:MAG: type I restriction endonuclease subunit R [Bacteroidaceae bacterium]|nr:type I restriction endonuclease subunit R [Bacteroidaceae bacterium]
MIENFNIVIQQSNLTVMTCYEEQPKDAQRYQSEAALEEGFIRQLVAQGYERLHITTEQGLIENLRVQLEKLNGIRLSDGEWKRLFTQEIANENLNIEDKTERIQRDPIVNILLDNGDTKNIRLIDKRDIHNNTVQVLNQYTPTGGTAKNRYDVTILVNGLPLVHVELKRRGVDIKEAFNQINRYGRETFWADNGLFDYVQLFVISNGTFTKYYSNTTRYAHVQEAAKQKTRVKTQSNSFEFTSYWGDAENRIINDLEDFTKTFLAKEALLNILTKYCVFTVDKNLMVMRPYQIAATERILLKIQYAHNRRLQGTRRAGGYIWHTTGSGKTLTSFKTAQLASRLPMVDKVLFVVDRKDLDYQTMKEYDNFEKDAANSNANASILLRQLNDPDSRIIITTIQKLSNLLKGSKEIDCLEKNVVLIFDECHRSQFGDMHQLITKKFKKYYIFGFTGTPIFAKNASGTTKDKQLATTAQLFGGEPDDEGNRTKPLHSYTIINAINDKNVLKFKIDYVRTMRKREGMEDDEVWGIDSEELLKDPRYIANNVAYILDNFARKTKRNEGYKMSVTQNVVEMAKARQKKVEEQRTKIATKGFNSIFAVDSTEKARLYYDEFMRQQADKPEDEQLRIATIFTYAANEAENDGTGTLNDENPEGTDRLDEESKAFLARAIDEYNKVFGTTYGVDAQRFANYYKDISLRMKNKEIDILIVVGMFLTGFDAKTLNTLWVDKNLKMHGLLQAFSRTNRILNAVKDCGNVVCFRNLEKQVKDCFALFGDENASGLITMRPFEDYYNGYDDEKGVHQLGYKEIEEILLEKFGLDSITLLRTLEEKKEFVRLFSALLKLRNLLSSFDEFASANLILNDYQIQDYTSWYIDLRDEFKHEQSADKEKVNDDVVFEIELVKQVQIGIEYILALVAEYHQSNCQDKEVVVKIQKAINASPDLRNKRELIEQFIERMTPSDSDDVFGNWENYVNEQRTADLQRIIDEERLKPTETETFIARAFEDGELSTIGTGITKLLPPMPLFGGGGKRNEKKRTVIEKLQAFFNKYFNL